MMIFIDRSDALEKLVGTKVFEDAQCVVSTQVENIVWSRIRNSMASSVWNYIDSCIASNGFLEARKHLYDQPRFTKEYNYEQKSNKGYLKKEI